MKADLADIYSQLDLRPDCSLEEFQYAYRRRVAQLHPDRRGGELSPEMEHTLRTLIALHASVCDFHRRHGRMPGALPQPEAESPAPSGIFSPAWPPHEPERKRPGPVRTTLTLIALFVALIVLLASWSWLTSRTGTGAGVSGPAGPGAGHHVSALQATGPNGIAPYPPDIRLISAAPSPTSRHAGTAPPPPSAAGSSRRTAAPGS